MKKRLLLACVAAMGVASAFAYNVGDYIYTRNGKFRVIGANLITGDVSSFTTMGGTPLNPDTIKVVSEGDDMQDSPNGQPYLMVAAGNIKSSLNAISEVTGKACANFKTVVPVEPSTRYVAVYKAKSMSSSTITTQWYTGRNMNYQNIVFRTDDVLDTDGVTSYGNWLTYKNEEGWVEMAYDIVPSDYGFLNFWFLNLVSGDCFGDFGVYKVEQVGDDRIVRGCIDEINSYLSIIPEKDGDATRQTLVEEILPTLEYYLENPDVSVNDVNEFVQAMTVAEDSPVKEFLNANTADVSKYFTNFTFDGLSTGNTRVASGWTSNIGTERWGLRAATGTDYNSFTTVHVKKEIQSARDNTMSAGSYSQTVDLPAGKYLYVLKAQAHYYYANGSGSSSDHYIPDYSNTVEGFKYFINSDTVALENVPTTKVGTYMHLWNVETDGEKTVGFYSPGAPAGLGLDDLSQNVSGGGLFCFDNVELRIVGENEDYIAEYFYGAAVRATAAELQDAIGVAEDDKDSPTYVFGKTDLGTAIETARAALSTYTAFTEDDLNALKNALSTLNAAVSAYKTLNAEYVTLGNDIEKCKTDLADESRPKAKDAFGTAISTAEGIYNSQTETSRDSLQLVNADADLLSAREAYLVANASVSTPAEINIVNGTFSTRNATGWTTDATTGNGVWKFQSNSDFTDGYCAYYNRGPSATDSKYIWQEVDIPAAGVYFFSAQIICRHYNMGTTPVEDAVTEMYIFANTDSTQIYTLPDPNIELSTNGQTYPGGVTSYYQRTDVSDLAAVNGKIRLGIAPTNNARTVYPNLIYIGSCHLYYYGSIEDYNTGIVDVDNKVDVFSSGDIYSISGAKVRSNATSLNGLPKGIYIMNGKKYVVK